MMIAKNNASDNKSSDQSYTQPNYFTILAVPRHYNHINQSDRIPNTYQINPTNPQFPIPNSQNA
ncbi:MAG: hypothetical protein F6K41_29665 [Symploca sp. SIO3E6]|nr:hypothetical protein [Caldora sp. SIO3E6]